MGTPVLTVPASPPPPTTPANHVCHRPPRRLPPPLHGRRPQPTPGTPPSSSSSSPTPFSASPSPRPWDCSVLLWPSCCSSPSKYRLCRMSAFSPRGAIVVSLVPTPVFGAGRTFL